jgi:hypothetical protein
MGGRRAKREREANKALEALEAEWRAGLARLEPGPGDEYFADLPVEAELDAGQRAAIRDFRAALARLRPTHVRPQDTSGSFDERGYYVRLAIRHQIDPKVQIRLVYGDGYLSLTWPDGEEHDKWEWSPLLATAVEALLSGRNVQTFHSRLGRVFAVDTDVWEEHGSRYRLRRAWRKRRMLLLLLPVLPTSRRRRSISFDRAQAIADEVAITVRS